MISICNKLINNIYVYKDIGTVEEFGVLKFNIDAFKSSGIKQYVNVKEYCTFYINELRHYYYPLCKAFFQNQEFIIEYDFIIKYFDIRPFLEYQYQVDMYSFDDYINFERYGEDLLKKYLWYKFENNNLYVKE